MRLGLDFALLGGLLKDDVAAFDECLLEMGNYLSLLSQGLDGAVYQVKLGRRGVARKVNELKQLFPITAADYPLQALVDGPDFPF